MAEHETIADIIAEMRGIRVREFQEYADRLEAAHKREADSIHRAMVILAGIEMPDADYPPRLWTALEDAYNALSDALGTDGDTTADEEEAKSSGRHFVIQPRGDAAKLREALNRLVIASEGFLKTHSAKYYVDTTEALDKANAALAAQPRNCDKYATADEALKAQEQMFNDSNFANGECKLGCPECDNPRVGCKIAWLFAPATEKEGGDK